MVTSPQFMVFLLLIFFCQVVLLDFFSTTFWRTWVSVRTISMYQETTSVQKKDIALLLVQFLGGFWREIVDWFTQHHFYWCYNSRVRQILSKPLELNVHELGKHWKLTRTWHPPCYILPLTQRQLLSIWEQLSKNVIYSFDLKVLDDVP